MFLIIGAFKSANFYIENKKKKKQGSAWGRVAQVALIRHTEKSPEIVLLI